MPSPTAGFARFRVALFAGMVIALQGVVAPRVRNLGCQTNGQTRWCKIRTTASVEVTGWVNGRYLREG